MRKRAAMTAMEITTRPPTTPPMIGAMGVFALGAGTGTGGDEGVGERVGERVGDGVDEDEDDDDDSELGGAGTLEKLMLDRLVKVVSKTEPPLV
jgi:hypothetical protein